jgi:hypothetical protein
VRGGISCSIFFSRPPKVNLAFPVFCQASALFEEYKFCASTQEENARKGEILVWGNCTFVLLTRWFALPARLRGHFGFMPHRRPGAHELAGGFSAVLHWFYP